MVVKEVGNEGKVQLGVAGHERCGCQEFAALKFVGIVEDLLCALKKVTRLEWRS